MVAVTSLSSYLKTSSIKISVYNYQLQSCKDIICRQGEMDGHIKKLFKYRSENEGWMNKIRVKGGEGRMGQVLRKDKKGEVILGVQ